MKLGWLFGARHLPRYLKILVESLFAPSILFFVLMGNILLALCIVAFFFAEKGVNPNVHSWFDVIWWGVATVTTVGYGDVVPVTVFGRIVAILLMVSGVLFFVGFSAILFSNFLEVEGKYLLENEGKEVKNLDEHLIAKLEEISNRLDRIEAQIKK